METQVCTLVRPRENTYSEGAPKLWDDTTVWASRLQGALYWTLIIGIIAGGVVHSLRPIDNYDAWLHIGIGREIVKNGTIPSQDIFSHTIAGKPWSPHEWLSEVFFFGVYRYFGLPGSRLCNAILFLAFFVPLVFLLLTRYGLKTCVGVTVLAFSAYWALGRVNWRPEAFTMIFTVVFSFRIFFRRSYSPPGVRESLCLYGLMVIWANMHGMSYLAVGLTALYVMALCVLVLARRVLPGDRDIPTGKEAMKWVLFLFGLVCSSLLVPGGMRMLLHAVNIVKNSSGSEFPIAEWSPWFDSFRSWISYRFTLQALSSYDSHDLFRVLYLLMLVTFPIWIWRMVSNDKLSKLPRVAVAACVLVFPLYYVRFTWLLFIPGFFVLDELSWIQRNRPELSMSFSRSARLLGRVSLMVIAFASVVLFLTGNLNADNLHLNAHYVAKRYPVGLAKFVEDAGLSGRAFNPYRWGGYLIYSSYPDLKVFVDGRNSTYAENDEDVFAAYKTIQDAGLGWERLVKDYNLDVLIMEWPDLDVFPPRPYRKLKKYKTLIPVLINREGVVFVRLEHEGGSPELISKIKSYYQSYAVDFNDVAGFVPDDLVNQAPEKAVELNVVPEGYLEASAYLDGHDDYTDKWRQAAVTVADSLIGVGIDEPAERLYRRILAHAPKDADALAGICTVLHFRAQYADALEWAASLSRMHPRDGRGDAMIAHMWAAHGNEISNEQAYEDKAEDE